MLLRQLVRLGEHLQLSALRWLLVMKTQLRASLGRMERRAGILLGGSLRRGKELGAASRFLSLLRQRLPCHGDCAFCRHRASALFHQKAVEQTSLVGRRSNPRLPVDD